jgi:PAS domain S-box-containing protein
VALELAGLCIGMLHDGKDGPHAFAPRSRVADRRRSALSRIVEQLPAALWTTDTELHLTSRAGAAATLAGVLPHSESGQSLLDLRGEELVSPDTVEAHRRALAGHSLHYHVQQDGRWFDAHVEPLRGDEGRIVGVVGVAVDVTDRENAFDEARQLQRELEDFIDNTPVGVHWAGPDGTVLRVNQAELDMLGYSRSEYEGKNVGDFYVDKDLAESCLRRLRRGETLVNVDVQLRHKDGSIRHGLLSSNARFERGDFVHTRCVTRDVSGLKAAEHAQALLAAIVESSDDAILAKTLEGIITVWNASAQRLYGYRPDEIVGRNVAVLIPPGHPNELEGIMERLRQGQRVLPYDTERRHKDGSLVRVSVTVSPVLDPSGKPVGASSIARALPS